MPTHHQFLPLSELGDPSRQPGKRLYLCAEGDWWNIQHTALQDACLTHGAAYSRTPRRGDQVQGPCPACGQRVVIDDFNPNAIDTTDLRCTDCQEGA